MWLTRKRRRAIAARIGFLNYYALEHPDVDAFQEMTEILADLCIDLGISWDLVQDAAEKYRQIKENTDD